MMLRRAHAVTCQVVLWLLLMGMAAGCAQPPKESARPWTSLQQKLQHVQQITPQWVAAGGSQAALAPLTEPLDRELKAGRFQEAEAIADRLLALLTSAPPAVTATSLQSKLQRIQTLVPQWVAQGGNHALIAPLGQEVDSAMKTGDVARADRAASRILAILQPNAPEQPVASTSPPVAVHPTAGVDGETRYLTFQIFTGGTDTSAALGATLSAPPSKDAIAKMAQEVIDAIGVKGSAKTKLGFVIGPLAFDQTDDEVRRLIDDAFAIARDKDVAVGFHLDTDMYWSKRTDLISDRNNLEWIDWDGTRTTGLKIDWGAPTKFPPRMCYESPAITNEVARRARDVIGAAIAAHLEALRKEQREDLFAGVIVGWETHMGHDFDTDRPLGFCTLTHRGFSAAHPPQDVPTEIKLIVRDFIDRWAEGIAQAGVPESKMYAHVAFVSQRIFREAQQANPALANLRYDMVVNMAPSSVHPSAAFGRHHRPGFTTYPAPGIIEQIHDELSQHGDPHWASSEGTNLIPGGGPAGNSGAGMEDYLAKRFNYGATLVNIFSWGMGGEAFKATNPFRIATEGPEAIAAYRAFLQGVPLAESGSTPKAATGIPQGATGVVQPALANDTVSDFQARLREKVRQVHAAGPPWVAAGGDSEIIMSRMQRFDGQLKQGNMQEADKILDEILTLVAPGSSRKTASSAEETVGPWRSIRLGQIPSDAALVFWSTRGIANPQPLDSANLYVMDTEGGNVTQLTFEPQGYEHAAVSPDRQYLAANRYLDAVGHTGLYLLDLANQREARLVPHFVAAGGGGVDWGPDGFIYFAGQPTPQSRQDVFKVRPDGTHLVQLTAVNPSEPGFESDVSVSEDGSLVAYVRMVAKPSDRGLVGKPQIWVMQADGSQQRMVDDGGPELGASGGFPLGDYDPEISPDHRYVVFSRTNSRERNFKESLNTAHDLWVAPLDGSAPAQRVTQPGPISIIPDWQDNTILYTEYNEREAYVGLVTIHPDGSGKRRLEPNLKRLWDGGRMGKYLPGHG